MKASLFQTFPTFSAPVSSCLWLFFVSPVLFFLLFFSCLRPFPSQLFILPFCWKFDILSTGTTTTTSTTRSVRHEAPVSETLIWRKNGTNTCFMKNQRGDKTTWFRIFLAHVRRAVYQSSPGVALWTQTLSKVWTCVKYVQKQLLRTMKTNVITGLDMCKVCTEAVHCFGQWTRTLSHVWTCVKKVPKQSIA